MFFPPVDKQKIFYFFEKTKIPKKSILIERKFPCVKKYNEISTKKKLDLDVSCFKFHGLFLNSQMMQKTVFTRIIISAVIKK